MSQCDARLRVAPDAGAVRPAIGDGVGHGLGARGAIARPLSRDEAGYAAHETLSAGRHIAA